VFPRLCIIWVDLHRLCHFRSKILCSICVLENFVSFAPVSFIYTTCIGRIPNTYILKNLLKLFHNYFTQKLMIVWFVQKLMDIISLNMRRPQQCVMVILYKQVISEKIVLNYFKHENYILINNKGTFLYNKVVFTFFIQKVIGRNFLVRYSIKFVPGRLNLCILHQKMPALRGWNIEKSTTVPGPGCIKPTFRKVSLFRNLENLSTHQFLFNFNGISLK